MGLMLRSSEFEMGHAGVQTDAGVRVALDGEERRALGADSGEGGAEQQRKARAHAANGRVGHVAGCLHMEHDFTDAWATDGSLKREWEGGRWRTRVAAGAFGGVAALEQRPGESESTWERRCVGAGMRGERLPSTYEIVDAELHAILMVLKEVAARPDAQQRRCLVMSDSLTALTMVERAWREGVRWHGPRTGRAGMLHAICDARRGLELLVTMWVPAHAGIAANAYADAAAKAHLGATLDGRRVAAAVVDALPAGRWVQTVAGAEGRAIWWGDALHGGT